MSKFFKTVLILIPILVCFCAIGIYMYVRNANLSKTCPRCVTLEKPQLSPLKKYSLELAKENSDIYLIIKEPDNKVIKLPEKYASNHNITLIWDEKNDYIWINSSDVGTYVYRQNNNGEWVRESGSSLFKNRLISCPPKDFAKRVPGFDSCK